MHPTNFLVLKAFIVTFGTAAFMLTAWYVAFVVQLILDSDDNDDDNDKNSGMFIPVSQGTN